MRAVSAESCITLIMNPTATTCMETSRGIPNREQASGINNRLPDGTPLAPQADRAAITHNSRAVPMETSIPSVLAAANVSVVMVIAAPVMLTVAPTGILTVYSSSLMPSFLARFRLTGILAAELRVKKAVTVSYTHLTLPTTSRV